jgi:hypothetical protein
MNTGLFAPSTVKLHRGMAALHGGAAIPSNGRTGNIGRELSALTELEPAARGLRSTRFFGLASIPRITREADFRSNRP